MILTENWKIQKPPKLVQGDTIGIIAPSLPILPSQRELYTKGKQVLLDLGFQVKEGKTVELQRWWAAGTPQEQAADINAMFANPEIKAIITHTGGPAALPVLDYLDYNLIRENPKPFLGYSDITLYHLAFFTKCGMVGFHADCLTHGLGDQWRALETSKQSYLKDVYLKMLTSSTPVGKIEPLTEWEVWREGKAAGPLIGGCLKRVALLPGTAYFPPLEAFDGAILFWEEIGEAMNDIWMYLYKLKHLGILERIAGMVIGKLTWVNKIWEETEYPSTREAVLDVVKEYDFPILAGLDFGHFTANFPMPIGIKIEMDTSTKSFSFLEAAVQ